MKRLLALSLSLSLLLSHQALGQDLGIPVGSVAPNAKVQTLDGAPVELSSLLAKGPVLLEFWATWCPNCKALEPKMAAVAQRYAGKIQLVAIAVNINENAARAKAAAEHRKLPTLMLWDANGDAASQYDAPATSYVVIVGKDGKIVYTGLGADQDLDDAVARALR